MRVGETFLVEASVQNCGDASGERSLTNFVVNACVKLESYPRREDAAQPLDGQNGIAGFPPGLWTRWFARERTFYPALCWQQRYLLTVESEPERGGIRLLMVLSDDRLNATGRRLLPSLISEDQWDDPAPYGDPWPGDREHRRRHVGRIRMKPRDEPIRAARGERKSVRDVEVISD